MFEILLESRHVRPPRPVAATVFSAILHAGIVALAIGGTTVRSDATTLARSRPIAASGAWSVRSVARRAGPSSSVSNAHESDARASGSSAGRSARRSGPSAGSNAATVAPLALSPGANLAQSAG